MSLYYAEDEEDDSDEAEDEALVMIFQWHDHTAADRFKHPLQKSYGPNGEAVRNDLWDEHVARPVRHFQSHGAKLETYKLELRAVEPRLQSRVRSGSKAVDRERSGTKVGCGDDGEVSQVSSPHAVSCEAHRTQSTEDEGLLQL
jgi:hypothetical protein